MIRTHFVGAVALAALQLILVVSLPFTAAASAASESTLYNFDQFPQGPSVAGLIADPMGNLYGTAEAEDGGALIVFRLSKDSHGAWTQTILQALPGEASVVEGLTLDGVGNLYGVGAGTAGCGSVYRLSPTESGPWIETTLYSFSCIPDGRQPTGPLILDSAGNLYGVTTLGGSGQCGEPEGYVGCGTVFELSPQAGDTYAETILYSFGVGDGYPGGPLAMDASGNLYGATESTVFELTPGSGGWTESAICQADCGSQNGVVLDSAGNLYFTDNVDLASIDVAVMQLSPGSGGAWTETTLYTYAPTGYFGWPSSVILDSAGNLYGAAPAGGAEAAVCGGNCGSIYELSKGPEGWTQSTLYSFTGANGAGPEQLLRNAAGDLYVTTNGKGGEVLELHLARDGVWKGKAIYRFPTGGTNSKGGLLSDGAGSYYGTAYLGGNVECGEGGCGAVFKLTPSASGWSETVLYRFNNDPGGDGSNPTGMLASDDAGNLYGTTVGGGNNCNVVDEGCGTVCKLSPNSNGTWREKVVYRFRGGSTDGWSPENGVVIDSAGNIYGVTLYGGAFVGSGNYGYGTVFMLKPSSNGKYSETILHSFGGPGDSWYPYAGVTLDMSGNLYGTADQPSGNLNGVVYRLSPSGGGWTESIVFYFTSASTGLFPTGNVIFDTKGSLYGVAESGGASGDGLAYELKPTPSGPWIESVLYNFGGVQNDAQFPQEGLTFDASGNLYGATDFGGLSGNGTVFELQPSSGGNWQEQVLYSFSGQGFFAPPMPNGPLVVDSSGNLLGTTRFGGTAEEGTIFEITP